MVPSDSPAGARVESVNERLFSYYPALGRVRKHVEENCSEPITLAQAAKVAAMETTYFSAFFHQKVGLTFTDWLRRFRIKNAMLMMASENYSVCEVAFAVGFNDLRTFGRAFKRYTRLTPSEYKRLTSPSPTTLPLEDGQDSGPVRSSGVAAEMAGRSRFPAYRQETAGVNRRSGVRAARHAGMKG